jgi:tetratricopeptide (TPR) repeat protein
MIVWVAFGQTLGHEFVNYDDGDYVYENPNVTRGLSLRGVVWAFTRVHAANWHPLTTLSHMLDCQFYGLQPLGHHLSNVLLQAAAAILLFLALRRLTGNLWPSAFVAAVFAIHPLRVESVAWISERKDVLSGVFFMLTLLAYARYARSERSSPGRYVTVVVLFALGLMCKPTLVTLPFVLLLLDYWPLGRMQRAEGKEQRHQAQRSRVTSAFQCFSGSAFERWPAVRGLVVEKVPLFVLSAASCVATVLAQRRAFETDLKLTFLERAANAVVSYVTYLGQMFYPANLAVLYPYPEGKLALPEVLLAALLLLIISVLVFLWRRKYPFLLVGWLWYLGMLIPMIGLVQVGTQARADRYTYLPQIGLYLLVTWGAMELLARWRFGRQVSAISALLAITVLTADSVHETSFWRNSETLWKRAIDRTSDNYVAYNNLGRALMDKGQLDEAISYFRKALQIKGALPEVEYNLGNVYLQKGQVKEAITHYQKAVQLEPAYADAEFNLGTAFLQEGDQLEAIAHYEKALEIRPDFAEVHINLGNVLLKNRQIDQAIDHYKKAVAIDPQSAEMQYNLGNALGSKGDWAGATSSYRAALQTQARDKRGEELPGRISVYAKAHNGLGVGLEKLGRADEAVAQFRESLQIDDSYPEAHYDLGCVLARLGQRGEAVAQLTEALRLKPDYLEAEEQLRELSAAPLP